VSRILDKSFVYTPSHETDLAKRFKQIQSAQKKLLRAWEEAIKEDAERDEAERVTVLAKRRIK